jgi:hypothetical protein
LLIFIDLAFGRQLLEAVFFLVSTTENGSTFEIAMVGNGK